MRQLSNKETYRALDADPTMIFQINLRTLLLSALNMGIITNREFEFIYCENPVIPIFSCASQSP